MTLRFLTTCLLTVLMVLAPAWGPGATAEPAADDGPRFTVLTSRDSGPYARLVASIEGVLSGREDVTDVVVRSFEADAERALRTLYEARKNGKSPLITIGSAAARAALEAPGDAPVVACMVGDADALAEASNATGVLLEFPIETQLQWIRRFVPNSQTIGVVYNPEENAERIKEARRIAKRLGLRLIAREVHKPQDLPYALESLARKVDLLWAVTDHMVLSRQTAQAILLYSFRNRMPFSGLSSSWVKAGALYSLDRDYEDLGEQCAEMAIEIMKGRRADSIPPALPRKVVYSLNLKTAEHLKLNLPQPLVDGAAAVYR